jgi:hypothetical protein
MPLSHVPASTLTPEHLYRCSLQENVSSRTSARVDKALRLFSFIVPSNHHASTSSTATLTSNSHAGLITNTCTPSCEGPSLASPSHSIPKHCHPRIAFPPEHCHPLWFVLFPSLFEPCMNFNVISFGNGALIIHLFV